MVIADLSETRIAAAVEASSGRLKAAIGDVAKLREAERIVGDTVSQIGGIDILVNNAGIETYAR